MLSRLLENWLDNASERSFQSPFAQILSAQGHIILHSTRHCALEYGKDVIAMDANGKLCAFQLKGNPGSRLTLNQFKEIQNQLFQLITQPVIRPGEKPEPHISYLVTNGLLEEEVQRAIDDLNRGYEHATTKPIGFPIKTISRGQLLSYANDMGVALWPSELKDINNILSLMTLNGKDIWPNEVYHKLLVPLLGLDENENINSQTELKRKITSAALLTSMCLKNFEIENNHLAIITAWITFSAYTVAACQKQGFDYPRTGMPSVLISEQRIFQALFELCEEITSREHLVEGDIFVDCFTYHARFTLLISLMAVYYLWSEEYGWQKEDQKISTENFLNAKSSQLYLWGEGAVPQFLTYFWYLRKTNATAMPDHFLASFLRQIIMISLNKNGNGLPGPYYKFEDITKHILRDFLSLKEDPFGGETFRNTSFFASSIMNLLVRTNLKQTCKSLWPDISKMTFRHFQPSQPCQYCLWRAPQGEDLQVQPKLTKEWSELVLESRNIACPEVPEALKNDKYLLILFVILFPFRGTPNVIRYLGKVFNDCWFIDDPIN